MHDGGSSVPHINKLKEQSPLSRLRANEAVVSFRCLHEGITQNKINNKRIKEREGVYNKQGHLVTPFQQRTDFVFLSSVSCLCLLHCQRLAKCGAP